MRESFALLELLYILKLLVILKKIKYLKQKEKVSLNDLEHFSIKCRYYYLTQ